MNNVVTSLAPSFLIGSSLFLQATRTPIKSQICSKFDRIRPGIFELPALECLEKFSKDLYCGVGRLIQLITHCVILYTGVGDI